MAGTVYVFDDVMVSPLNTVENEEKCIDPFNSENKLLLYYITLYECSHLLKCMHSFNL